MARNGTGTYSRAVGAYIFDTVISETDVNAEMDDIANALTASIAKDGQTTPTANLPMGTYRHTGVGNGSARTDYTALGQMQDGIANWAEAGGTADALTATYSPALAALVDGQLCFVRAAAANETATPTFAPNGLTARTIVKRGGAALNDGNIAGAGHELILRYDLDNTQWELLNPDEAASALDLDAASADFPWQFFTVKDASPVYVGDGSGDKLRVNFDGGTAAMSAGDTVVAASGGYGIADIDAVVTSGTYGGSDAAGYIVLRGATGTFSNNDNLSVSASVKAVQNGATSAVYNLDYMNGIWQAINLYWDLENGCISRFEATKNRFAVGYQIASTRFPDSAIADYSAMTVWRVKPASAATATQSPDRLVSPTAGQNGGPQFIRTFTSEGQQASGGQVDEMDGDGSTHGYERRCIALQGTAGDVQTWFVGQQINAYAASDDKDVDGVTCVRWGLLRAVDISTPSAPTISSEQYVIQRAATGSGAPSWVTILSVPVGATHTGLGTLKAGTPLVQAPLANATVTQAHGLGVLPAFLDCVLECTTADNNYSVGDKVQVGSHERTAGGGTVWSIEKDATNVYLRNNGGQPNIADKTSRTNGNITVASWKLTITPYAFVT